MAYIGIAVILVLLWITVIDLRERRIPNVLVGALFLLALARVGIYGAPGVRTSLIGMVIGSLPFFVAAFAGVLGMGDAKLTAAMGALLGWPAVLPALFCGILTGGLVSGLLLLSRRIERKERIPYGPFLALGGIVGIFWQIGLLAYLTNYHL